MVIDNPHLQLEIQRRFEARRKEMSVIFCTAHGWECVQRELAAAGLSLVQGRQGGLSISDGECKLRTTEISSALSRPRLEERFGETWMEFCARKAR